MSVLDFFTESYADARERFRAACPHAVTFRHGPESDDAPTTDVAWFGPEDAARVVLVTSGVHGLEGLAGAACQLGWVRSGAADTLPENTAVMLVHLVNPFGVLHQQRETPEGVDLNRNFVDFPFTGEENRHYEQIHDALTANPQDVAFLDSFRKEQGDQLYAKALLGGQYGWPRGLSFGGSSATEANRILNAIVTRYLQSAKDIVHLDYHTGLGPWAHASLIIFADSSDPAVAEVKKRFGPSVLPVGPVVSGHTGAGVAKALPDSKVTSITVEFGTDGLDTEFRVVRDEFWRRMHEIAESPEGERIHSSIVEYFYPRSPDWRELIFCRSQQIISNALLPPTH